MFGINDKKEKVVRMAPSPTGNLHIGTARTTLFNFLFAKKYGAKFIMRIEDTDKERSTPGFEKNILDGLKWLSLNHDEFYRQSERTEVYKEHLKKMIDNGSAYISKEEPKEEGERSEVIRFKNPNTKITFNDLIRGEVTFDTTELGDFVIAKSLEEPLYHLAVVVDDFLMGVTHVIRGEDHISNTPRQILILESIGAERPEYAHLPLILDDDKKKLSKRKHGEAVWIDYYRKQGYLPEAILNFLALLGWSSKDDREIYKLDELINAFDIERVHKGGAIFNDEKLRSVNREHIKLLSQDEVRKEVESRLENLAYVKDRSWDIQGVLDRILPIIVERISVWGDIDNIAESGELDYFFAKPSYSRDGFIWKGNKEKDSTVVTRHLESVLSTLDNIPEKEFTRENIKSQVWPYAEAEGRGDVLWPFRYSLCGREKSPDPFALSEIFGKEETKERIDSAIKFLKNEI